MPHDTPELLFDESLNEAIREFVPEPIVTGIEYATHLGDGATIAAIAVLMYWFSAERRRTRVYVIAVGIGALGISTGLKGLFARSRPDPTVLEFAPDVYGGFSFPSAHALGSAALFAMLAITLDVGKRWQRVLFAALIVFTIMLSRVILGVHYVADVIVGAAIGLAFVWVMFRTYPRYFSPRYAFAVAFFFGVLGLAFGAREHSFLVVGSSIGMGLTWELVKYRKPRPTGAAMLVLGVLLLPLFFVWRAVEIIVQVHWLPLIVGYAVATSLVILVPHLAERLNELRVVVWLQNRLPFRGRTVDPEAINVADITSSEKN